MIKMSWENELKKMAMNNSSFFAKVNEWLENPETERDKLYKAIKMNYDISLELPEYKRSFRFAIQKLIESREDNPFSPTHMGRKGGN